MPLPQRLQPLLNAGSTAAQLAALFHAQGHDLYLVGGTVRDALLARPHEDLDFATGARPDEIRRIVAGWADDLYLAGQAFGTVGVVKLGAVHEITTFRSDVYVDDSRKPSVSFSDDIESDLARRDFTVNALAIKVPVGRAAEPEIVDPHRGLSDLGARVLRTPSGAETSFGDDPLRMLRLFRFAATLGFAPDEATLSAVPAMAKRLQIVSGERIRDELNKLIVGDQVAAALWGLVDSGLAAHFVPELPDLALQQDPIHQHKDVLAHTVAVVEKVSPVLIRRLAALFHDIGKPATRAIAPGGVSFHHHEVVGARMTRRRLKALRYPRKTVDEVSELVFLHMRPHTFKMGWTDSAVRRYVRDAGHLLADLNDLVRSDVTTRNRKRARAISSRIDELERRIAELREREELEALRPPIDGHAVMSYLGLDPGPLVGEVMKLLLDHRLDHGPYSEEEAYALLDEWKQTKEGAKDR